MCAAHSSSSFSISRIGSCAYSGSSVATPTTTQSHYVRNCFALFFHYCTDTEAHDRLNTVHVLYRIAPRLLQCTLCILRVHEHYRNRTLTSDCILFDLWCAVTAFGDVLGTSFLVIVFATLYYVFHIGTLTTWRPNEATRMLNARQTRSGVRIFHSRHIDRSHVPRCRSDLEWVAH